MEKNIQLKQQQHINLALLICLVGFPQISETIYTPSLTSIAENYNMTLNLAQMTLSIYFLSFAFGVFFWGISSDYIGRRKAMIYGIFIYILGSLVCFMSTQSITLFIGRFIQAFGASTGSITTQTILRDNYHGEKRHKLFAKISAALSFSPALGPLLGGYLGQYYGFRSIFLTLVLMGIILVLWSLIKLPETKENTNKPFKINNVINIGNKMLFDRYTITFCILIGIFNGILFSYYSEAPVIFMDKFHFMQSHYGYMGCVVSLATILGAWLSNKKLKVHPPILIIQNGILLSLSGSILLCLFILFTKNSLVLIILYILCVFIILTGIGLALPNCLSLALSKFSNTAGTAGAFLSLGYYIIVSLCTLLMSLLHTGSILIFPLFCVGLLLTAFYCLKKI